MKNLKKKLLVGILCILALTCVGFKPMKAQAASSVVSSRLKSIQKEYKTGSRFNKWVSVAKISKVQGEYEISGAKCGGCNGLVAYVTLRVFHNPYVPGIASYQKVGKSTSTKSTAKMKKLFKKAKVGDVVNFGGMHYAIFLSDSNQGIYIYEANFGSKNKVYNKHLWRWSNIKSWARGAKSVSVYRSYNYNAVNKKKAAKNYKVGATFTYGGVIYKVKSNSAKGGTCKAVGYDNTYPYDRRSRNYIEINQDYPSYIEAKTGDTDLADGLRNDGGWNDSTYIGGEQRFKVVK